MDTQENFGLAQAADLRDAARACTPDQSALSARLTSAAGTIEYLIAVLEAMIKIEDTPEIAFGIARATVKYYRG